MLVLDRCSSRVVDGAARKADRLDDDLTSLWESVWDQRGEPERLTRWNEPLRFRVGGPQGARHRAAIAAAVGTAAQAAELQASEVSLPPPGSNDKDTTNLALLVYDDDDLDDNTPCDAQLHHIDLGLSYVRVRMRTSHVWDCVNHELMHASAVRDSVDRRSTRGHAKRDRPAAGSGRATAARGFRGAAA